MMKMPDSAAVKPDAVFEVRVKHCSGDLGLKPQSKGTLAFERNVVVLSGKAPITGLPFPLCSRAFSKQIPLCEVMDVAQDGANLSFDCVRDGVTRSSIVLQAASRQDASAMVALLPTQTSPEFVEQQRQYEVFTTAIHAVTPTAFVTPTIIALNVLVFVAMGIAGLGWFDPDPERMLSWGADYWPLTTSGQWYRLVTSAFLHFGVIHLMMNMYALFSVGLLAERFYGNRFFAVIYLFGAVTSSLASSWWDRDAVCAGASGAIFALYGAMLAYLVFQPGSFPKGAVQSMMKSTLLFVGYNVFYGFTHAGISNSAHLGGLAGGVVMGIVLCRPLDLTRRASQAVPRLAIGAAFGLAVIVAGLSLLPKCGSKNAFLAERQSVAAEEENADNAGKALFDQVQAEKLSAAEFIRRLDSDVLAKWEALSSHLAALSVSEASPSKSLQSKRLHEIMVRYCQRRRDAYLALRDYSRTGNKQRYWDFRVQMTLADAIEGERRLAAQSQP